MGRVHTDVGSENCDVRLLDDVVRKAKCHVRLCGDQRARGLGREPSGSIGDKAHGANVGRGKSDRNHEVVRHSHLIEVFEDWEVSRRRCIP